MIFLHSGFAKDVKKNEPERVVTEDQLENKDSKYYIKGETTPYTGKISSFFENGQPKIEGYIKNGYLDGTCMGWYKSGKRKLELVCNSDFNEKKITFYYENGQKMLVVYSKDKKAEGEETEWYKNGVIKSQKVYKDGKEHGKHIYWHNNGKKR